MKRKHALPGRQHGAVAILVAFTLAVLVGFLGIVVDLGRLFVTKTELQSALDACALAASAELRPGTVPTDTDAITRAVNAGTAAAGRNSMDFQNATVTVTADDILFSENLSDGTTVFPFGYVDSALANPATAKYAMCARNSDDIPTWFMQVLESFIGVTSTPNHVGAWAVATLSPAQTNCGIPIGICKKPGSTGPAFGWNTGDWVSGRFDAGGGSTGSFNWIDFSPPSGGASELANLLTGNGQCDLNVTNPVGQTGVIGNSAAKAWNSRFGLYQGGGGNPNLTSAPPDFTGYAYTDIRPDNGLPGNWPSGSNAYPDFQARRNLNQSYGANVQAGNAATGLSISNAYNPTTTTGQHQTYGADRRMTTAPIVDCGAWASAQTVPILGWACVLMLHPISSPGDTVHMEFRGASNQPGSPCATSGLGGGTAGPFVPVLVQ